MATSEQDHSHLSTLLSEAGLEVVLQEVVGDNFISQLEQTSADVLLVDLSDDTTSEVDIIDTLLEYDSLPVFFNDGSKAGIETDALWAKKLARRLEQMVNEFEPEIGEEPVMAMATEPESVLENEPELALDSVENNVSGTELASDFTLELEPVIEQKTEPGPEPESRNEVELEVVSASEDQATSESVSSFELGLDSGLELEPELETALDSKVETKLEYAPEIEDQATTEPASDFELALEPELSLESEPAMESENEMQLELDPDFEELASQEPETDFSLDTETFTSVEDEISEEIESLPQSADSALVALKEESSVSDLPEGAAVNVWVLGASLGGPQAVRQFLMAIRKDLPVAFVLAQHIGENHISLLAEQLDRVSKFKVFPGYNGHMIRHHEVILAPAGKNIHITDDGYISLSEQEENAIYSPCINDVMTSVAKRYGNMAGTIVFSGMGDDGAIGCQSVAENGGIVWAQDVDSCVISSMPDQARKTNNVTFSANPRRLADELYKYYTE